MSAEFSGANSWGMGRRSGSWARGAASYHHPIGGRHGC